MYIFSNQTDGISQIRNPVAIPTNFDSYDIFFFNYFSRYRREIQANVSLQITCMKSYSTHEGNSIVEPRIWRSRTLDQVLTGFSTGTKNQLKWINPTLRECPLNTRGSSIFPFHIHLVEIYLPSQKKIYIHFPSER